MIQQAEDFYDLAFVTIGGRFYRTNHSVAVELRSCIYKNQVINGVNFFDEHTGKYIREIVVTEESVFDIQTYERLTDEEIIDLTAQIDLTIWDIYHTSLFADANDSNLSGNY